MATRRPSMPRQNSKATFSRTKTNLYREQIVDIIREVTQIQKEKKKSSPSKKQISDEEFAIQEFKIELERHKLQSRHGNKEPTLISEKADPGGEDETDSEDEGDGGDGVVDSSDEYDTDLEIEGRKVSFHKL